MKRYYFLTIAALVAASVAAYAQETGINSGKVIYTEKIKLEIKLEGDAAQMANMLPTERTSEKVLLFGSEATLFQDGVTPGDDMPQEEGGGVRIKMVVSGQDKLFTDLKKKTFLDQKDFMNRIFLIESPIAEQGWKITGQQKAILGYPCMEAEKSDTAGKKTIAWFSPSINVSSGPAGLCNLPGMILEADIDNGSRIYTAKSVESIPEADLKIQKPREGKKVTEAEFKTIVADKMKEMGIENGSAGNGGAQVRIIIKK